MFPRRCDRVNTTISKQKRLTDQISQGSTHFLSKISMCVASETVLYRINQREHTKSARLNQPFQPVSSRFCGRMKPTRLPAIHFIGPNSLGNVFIVYIYVYMSIYLLGKFSLSRAGCARVIVMRLRRDYWTRLH